VILCAGELMMRSPGIVAIHATTSANSLHYIYGASGDDTTRRLALLQAVGWQPLYRGRAKPPGGPSIDALEAAKPGTSGDEAVGEVFELVSTNRGQAAGKVLGYLNGGGSTDLVFDAARRLIFHKGKDSHDYKYGAAAWEECVLTSDPKWRGPMIAAALYNLPGSKTPDSPLMIRAREAVKTVLR
jgi:hypothetical protein